MENTEYVFWVIADIADQPKRYWIYRANDRREPVAYVVFENKDFTVSGDPSLSSTEQLNILRACNKFLIERYYPDWD